MSRLTAYSLLAHGEMINDTTRMAAYARALRNVIRPDCTVLDIGAGTGILSLLACRFGAGRVHAVEFHDTIELGSKLATDNGFADRITIHQCLSTELELPEGADVIVSDLHGVTPFYEHHITSIIDARTRLLASGGVLIPSRDRIWGALVEDPVTYRRYEEPWVRNDYGLILDAGHPLVVSSYCRVNAREENLLVEPVPFAVLDYMDVTTADVRSELKWSINRVGIAHGLLLWFDAELAPGVGYSNAPGETPLVYGQAFFPLETPVSVEQGDSVEVVVRAKPTVDDYIWQWNTRIRGATPRGTLKADFRQSTFFANALSREKLEKTMPGFSPRLGDEGVVDRFILESMDGEATIEEIALRVYEKFHDRFASLPDAKMRVRRLSVNYSR